MRSEGECEIDGLPVSALASRNQKARYGTVPGLPVEELADPDELERQVYMEEFAPVLILPIRGGQSQFRPGVDESGGVDWGAFGTVDFERMMSSVDKTRGKIGKLRNELENVLIMLSIVKEGLPGTATYLVLKYLRMGIIELDHVTNDDVLAAARLYLRARRLQKEIARLKEARRVRAERQLPEVLR